MAAKSIFQSKIFQAAAITLISGLAAIGIKCCYAHRAPSEEEATVIVGLFTSFGLTVAGRVNTTPVHTPKYLPGPDPDEQTETSTN